MATRYQIQVGDEIIEFEAPDGLSEEQIVKLAEGELKTAKPGQPLNVVFDPTNEQPVAEALPDSGAVGSFMRGLPADATFNFGDEIASGANALIPGLASLDNATGASGGDQQSMWGDDASGFWDTFRNNMADLQRQRASDDLQHPYAASTGRVAGVFSTLPLAARAVAARLPAAAQEAMAARPVLTTTGLSAAGGGVSGAGAGHGNRGQSAAIGTLAGAGLGAVASGAMALAPAIANYAKIFFGRGSDQEAMSQIIRALARDGYDVTSPSGVQALRTELASFTGKPVSLADIGAATRSRAGVGLRSPSAVQNSSIDAVRERQAGQAQRLAEDVRQNVAPRTDVHALEGDLIAQRAQEAERLRDLALFEDGVPLPPPNARPQIQANASPELDAGLRRQLGEDVPDTYSQVPAVTPDQPVGRTARVIDDEVLQNLVRTPLGQRALQKAQDLARGEYALRAAQGLPTDHIPYQIDGANLDVRTLDYMKRYLDDEVGRLYRGGSSTNSLTGSFDAAELNQVKELRNALRERMKTVVPQYGDYLKSYAGSSEMIEALEQGQNFGRMAPELIQSGQASRSQAGQELYRVGAARSLIDDIMQTRDTGNEASRILNSEEARRQLAATGVDPAHAAALNRSVQQERQLNQLPAELAGAQTNQRALATADANAGADLAVPFNPGSPLGWAGMIGRTVLNRSSINRNAAVNEQLLPRILETDTPTVDRIIDELEQRGNIAAARAMRRNVRQRQVGGVGSVMIGGSVALPEEDY